MAPSDDKAKEDKKNELARITQEIWRIVPNVKDFEELKYILRPYIMRMPVANHRSPSLNTDPHGFRRLVVDDAPVSYAQFCDAPQKKGALLGDSVIYGYGLADNETLHAQLSEQNGGDTLWYSFSAPVINTLQMRLLLELFLPPKVDYVTLFVTTSAPVIYLQSPFDTRPYPVLFGQSTDAMFNAGAVTRRQSKKYKLASGVEVHDPRQSFQYALDDVRKNIRLIASALQTLTSTRLLVCFRASPQWLEKPLAPQERKLMDLFINKHKTHIGLTLDPELKPYWTEYVAQIEKLTKECGADFIDFNKAPELKSSEWLFFDQFHPNATGVSHIAKKIRDWADNTDRQSEATS
jgi:lysophospholipase L1-like esterase